MPKLDPIEQALEKLAALKTAPLDPSLLDEHRGFLHNRSNLVVRQGPRESREGEPLISNFEPQHLVPLLYTY